MKKKLVSALLCATMTAGCLAFAGCGGSDDSTESKSDAADDSADAAGDDAADDADAQGDTSTGEEVDFSGTFGDENGTKLSMWTFVDVHANFYGKMVEMWNEKNPDNTISLEATAYPFADMHQKLLMSFQAGEGAPDIVDVEAGQYPNVIEGLDTWLYPLDDAMAEYKEDMVQSRLEIYMGSDGHYYGAPFHVGATVMYYNLGELEKYGIKQEDIDAIVTWEDWKALGKKYVEARGEEGKFWTSVDTGGTDWIWIAMAEHGEDWTGTFEEAPNVQLESVKKMLTLEQSMLNEGIAEVSPEGQVDTDPGISNILEHNIVAFPKAMWYMSRFLDKMPDEKGNWYIAPCPVFEEGQPRSVGIGGTGTVVTQQSANKELAADFVCYAKMSPDGSKVIWEDLGFDVCNTSLWDDDEFAHNKDNKYNTFFRNMPYDVLNEIKDEIGKISILKATTTIGEQFNLTSFNEILEEGRDIDEVLQEAQDAIDLEQ
ncbi:MAG: extracellular solute-binding protein [Eubacterium sp.]|nr:extracellular solute-binding protein [Eubacterium sp.]